MLHDKSIKRIAEIQTDFSPNELNYHPLKAGGFGSAKAD